MTRTVSSVLADNFDIFLPKRRRAVGSRNNLQPYGFQGSGGVLINLDSIHNYKLRLLQNDYWNHTKHIKV